LEIAMELDTRAWERFAASEARRIMSTFAIPQAGGLESLERALALRMYALINQQHAEWSADRRTLRFVMDRCRVQETRREKGITPFPCRSVGAVEFTTFAHTIDPRIATRCLHCPPEPNAGGACTWEFALEK